jgi:hypothetical protein
MFLKPGVQVNPVVDHAAPKAHRRDVKRLKEREPDPQVGCCLRPREAADGRRGRQGLMAGLASLVARISIHRDTDLYAFLVSSPKAKVR